MSAIVLAFNSAPISAKTISGVSVEAAIIPLWLFYENTGTKKSLTFKARADRFIYAMNVRPAK